jgi:hypothetical protein
MLYDLERRVTKILIVDTLGRRRLIEKVKSVLNMLLPTPGANLWKRPLENFVPSGRSWISPAFYGGILYGLNHRRELWLRKMRPSLNHAANVGSRIPNKKYKLSVGKHRADNIHPQTIGNSLIQIADRFEAETMSPSRRVFHTRRLRSGCRHIVTPSEDMTLSIVYFIREDTIGWGKAAFVRKYPPPNMVSLPMKRHGASEATKAFEEEGRPRAWRRNNENRTLERIRSSLCMHPSCKFTNHFFISILQKLFVKIFIFSYHFFYIL